MTSANGSIDQTLMALNAGLRVEHIATNTLVCVAAGDEVGAVLSSPELRGFDQIPVKREQSVVGVLERGTYPPVSSVGEVMHPLDESMIVAGSLGLGRFLPRMVGREYQLVILGDAIGGIVTRSDVLKLPVRIYAFSLITFLEMSMAAVISEAFPDSNAWIDLLAPGRQEKTSLLHQQLAAEHLDPPLIESTEFIDKVTVIKRHFGLTNDEEKQLFKIQQLRNDLAHAKDFARDAAGLQKFVNTLEMADFWCRRISTLPVEGGDTERD